MNDTERDPQADPHEPQPGANDDSDPEDELQPTSAAHRQRDALSLLIIGTFLSIFAILVLFGTLWESRTSGVIVNMGAGLTLFAVGMGMSLAGVVKLRR